VERGRTQAGPGVSEALSVVAMLAILGSVTHLSVEAVVANEERNEAVAAAMRAEAVANEMEWVAIQAVERQDSVCECTYNLVEDPTISGHLRHAAAIHCKRCRILSINGPSNE
jgi:Tfp pilus assembly major pilin PilA